MPSNFSLGDLLLKMEALDERLLAAIFMFEEDSQTPEKPQEKSASLLRPFRWFTYLQKERPAEFNALSELKQKLKSGKLLSILQQAVK